MSKVIIALDYDTEQAALAFLEKCDPARCPVKIGKGMFTRFGPDFVKRLVKEGYSVFLDLKFHDIPKTVANACMAAADLGVWMLNVHVSGGRAMLLAAREAIDGFSGVKPLLIGVTVLTSLGDDDMKTLGVAHSVQEQVARLGTLAQEAGLDGVVCAPREIKLLRKLCGKDFCLVTPGIRPIGIPHHDQFRVMTPGEASAAGADYLVIGRPITQSADPLPMLTAIELDMEQPSMS